MNAHGYDFSYLFPVVDEYISAEANLFVLIGNSQVKSDALLQGIWFCSTMSDVKQTEADRLCLFK